MLHTYYTSLSLSVCVCVCACVCMSVWLCIYVSLFQRRKKEGGSGGWCRQYSELSSSLLCHFLFFVFPPFPSLLRRCYAELPMSVHG